MLSATTNIGPTQAAEDLPPATTNLLKLNPSIMIKLLSVATVIRDISKSLPTARCRTLVWPLSCVHPDMFGLSPQPLESHFATIPGTLQRPYLTVDALMTLQVLVGTETLAT